MGVRAQIRGKIFVGIFSYIPFTFNCSGEIVLGYYYFFSIALSFKYILARTYYPILYICTVYTGARSFNKVSDKSCTGK
jgi:hypothetical protein